MPTPPTLLQWIAAALFGAALLHTFSTGFFAHRAHKGGPHAGLWHLFAEVEVVFFIWAAVLLGAMAALQGTANATAFIDSTEFTEPMFVFVVMVMAATRPILYTAEQLLLAIDRVLPLRGVLGLYLMVLSLIPLLGSFITEPAAMTLAALLLARQVYAREVSQRLKYATMGVLFVNISIGGTLTPFAAPPVLMVARVWDWDMAYMLQNFGGKAALAVAVNAVGVTLWFRRELTALPPLAADVRQAAPAPMLTVVHLLALLGVVVWSHHPAVFCCLFLVFLGVVKAYPTSQSRLIIPEALLVAVFLAGLVMLGRMQTWWLQPLLQQMDAPTVFFGAMGLTAFTDNAALTYLGSLIPGLSPAFQYALVAGAVAGGGLTVIANAPNPAGLSILRPHFPEESVGAVPLLLAALAPTLVAAMAFRFL